MEMFIYVHVFICFSMKCIVFVVFQTSKKPRVHFLLLASKNLLIESFLCKFLNGKYDLLVFVQLNLLHCNVARRETSSDLFIISKVIMLYQTVGFSHVPSFPTIKKKVHSSLLNDHAHVQPHIMLISPLFFAFVDLLLLTLVQ